MPRSVDLARRAALREATADYILAHGLTGLSLRPLAAALGTSARMLVHHFGSREALLREALEFVRGREAARFQAWVRRRPGRPPSLSTAVRWYWRRLSSPRLRPALRLLFEIHALAMRDPSVSQWLIEPPVEYWRELLASTRGGARRGRRDDALAALFLGVFRGLLLDLAATGDRRRAEAAFAAFERLVARRAAPRSLQGGSARGR